MEKTEKSLEELTEKFTEEIEIESYKIERDKIAARLGPDIQKRIIGIHDSATKYAVGVTVLGGLATTVLGYTSGLFKCFADINYSPEPSMIASLFGGGLVGSTLGIWIGNKKEKRGYNRLKKEFPDKFKDIQRLDELKDEIELVS